MHDEDGVSGEAAGMSDDGWEIIFARGSVPPNTPVDAAKMMVDAEGSLWEWRANTGWQCKMRVGETAFWFDAQGQYA